MDIGNQALGRESLLLETTERLTASIEVQ